MRKKICNSPLALFIVLCFAVVESLAQQAPLVRLAGRGATIEPRALIDFPTAGVLPRNSFSSSVEFFQNGGVLASFSVGVIKRVNVGISYGGNNLIGSSSATFHKSPGFHLKWRLFDETPEFVAIAIGFESQGKEPYIDSTKRYTIKSPGFFLVFSKNYSFLGYLSIHGGLNYSLERNDGDKDLNGFLGVEKTLGPTISLIAEYNLGINDDGGRSIGRGHGYLNLGLRWAAAHGFSLGVDFKNLAKNRSQETFSNRILRLEYMKYF